MTIEDLLTPEKLRPRSDDSPRMRMWRLLAAEHQLSHCCKAELAVQSGAGVYCGACGQPRLA